MELDVHVIEMQAGVVVPLCDVPWPLVEDSREDSLDGHGLIDGPPVGCVSAPTQVAMHRGMCAQERMALLRQLT